MAVKDGDLSLLRDHAYYYQVQAQLNVCKLPYCDFVVWIEIGIAVERITVDVFSYVTVMEGTIFHLWHAARDHWKVVHEETIADHSGVVPLPSSTTTHAPDTDEQSEDYTKTWCYCSQPSYGTMIQCDNSECNICWFHCDCLRIRSPPKGQWYCPACCTLPRLTKRKSAKTK